MIDDLSEKERVTLRLIVRGHDAKTAARELGLSVHTINERLRSARRKLGVTSSKEAARILLASEQSDPQSFVDKQMGGAIPATLDDPTAITQRSRKLALWTGGIIVMSVLFSALTLAFLAAPTPEHSNAEQHSNADQHSSAEQGEADALTADLAPIDTASEKAAREWLALVDDADWQGSFDAAGSAFREPNTVKGWRAASHEVRTPLGAVSKREVIKTQFVNAPPNGFTMVRFLTQFAGGKTVIETVTLEMEAGSQRVVGYLIE